MHSHSKSLMVLNFAAICYGQKQSCCIRISIFAVWKTVVYYMWRHPLCEDVDWNFSMSLGMTSMMRSSFVRGCGLKYAIACRKGKCREPSFVQGCGLKLRKILLRPHDILVILYARMWIEILSFQSRSHTGAGHPLCEDVDWNNQCFPGRTISKSHPLCEDVDWNLEVVE